MFFCFYNGEKKCWQWIAETWSCRKEKPKRKENWGNISYKVSGQKALSSIGRMPEVGNHCLSTYKSL